LTRKTRIEKYGRGKNTDFYGLPFFDIAPLNTDIFTILSQTVGQKHANARELIVSGRY